MQAAEYRTERPLLLRILNGGLFLEDMPEGDHHPLQDVRQIEPLHQIEGFGLQHLHSVRQRLHGFIFISWSTGSIQMIVT